MDLGRDVLLKMYDTMTTVRQCDDKVQKLIMTGKMVLFYHSPRGQEAIAAGIGAVVGSDDYLVTTYRELHEAVAKGISLRAIWAEWMGKTTGTCRGRGGGMHLSDPEVGVMATSGIVGGGIPISVGLALGSHLQGNGRVTACSFGDGASNIGGFHESLNMASVWKLPVVFICQNNGYAEHMEYSKGTSVATVADRSVAYSMPGVTVDGNDPVAVAEAVGAAVARARAGEGPSLVEVKTYRLSGHFVGDDSHYLPKQEVSDAVAADPVPRFRARLVEELGVREQELVEIEWRAAAAVTDAYEFGLASPLPDPESLLQDVYSASTGAI